MSGRRSFLKGFGLIGAVVAGATTPVVVQSKTKVVPAPLPGIDKDVVKVLTEQAPATLTLQATYGEVAPPPPPPTFSSPFTFTNNGTEYSRLVMNGGGGISLGLTQKQFVPGTENKQAVSLVPGPDGNLYIKVGDTWKRVLTTES